MGQSLTLRAEVTPWHCCCRGLEVPGRSQMLVRHYYFRVKELEAAC